jgi:hypothetical protein
MTSGIDTSARIASMFRSALAAQQKAKVGAREPVGKAAAAAPRSPADLSGLIASRVSAVPVDDPERKSKVFRAFLEAMLVAELGERLLVDPAFATMVDAVQGQMQEDPQIAAAVDQAVQALLAPPSSGS